MRYSEFWPLAAKAWDNLKIVPHGPEQQPAALERFCRRALEEKRAYKDIERATGVPWAMLAALHLREGSQDFSTYLGNGQPLNRRTTQVPKKRGPFKTFFDGAVDAIKVEKWGDVRDWRLEKMFYYIISFNGWGYGWQSPYLWAGTNAQKRGKYVGDKKFKSLVWDTQPGCAAFIKTLAGMDPTIMLTRED